MYGVEVLAEEWLVLMLNINPIGIVLNECFGYPRIEAAKLGKEIQNNLDNYIKIQKMFNKKYAKL